MVDFGKFLVVVNTAVLLDFNNMKAYRRAVGGGNNPGGAAAGAGDSGHFALVANDGPGTGHVCHLVIN